MYLREYKLGTDIAIIARIRCGNLDRSNKYWGMESDRLCTLCKKQEGSLENMVNSCETVKTCKIGAQNKVYTYNEIFSQIVDRKLIELVTKIERMINDTKEKENNRANDDE